MRHFSKRREAPRLPDMAEKISLALVGAGSMGGALLRAWLEGRVLEPSRSYVFDPAIAGDLAQVSADYGLSVNPKTESSDPDLLVLAIKPQIIGTVLPAYAPLAGRTAVVSILAGATIKSIQDAIGVDARLARAMPNLPAKFRAGLTGLFLPPEIKAFEEEQIERIFGVVGRSYQSKDRGGN